MLKGFVASALYSEKDILMLDTYIVDVYLNDFVAFSFDP